LKKGIRGILSPWRTAKKRKLKKTESRKEGNAKKRPGTKKAALMGRGEEVSEEKKKIGSKRKEAWDS